MRVAVPFNAELSEGLRIAADPNASLLVPTGALAFKARQRRIAPRALTVTCARLSQQSRRPEVLSRTHAVFVGLVTPPSIPLQRVAPIREPGSTVTDHDHLLAHQ